MLQHYIDQIQSHAHQVADYLWGAGAASAIAFSITTEDLTGPVSALVILVAIGVAVWRGAGVLFRAWLGQCSLDRKERTERHAENLQLHQYNAGQMKTLVESQQLAQLETAKAVRENALALSKMADSLDRRPCTNGQLFNEQP